MFVPNIYTNSITDAAFLSIILFKKLKGILANIGKLSRKTLLK